MPKSSKAAPALHNGREIERRFLVIGPVPKSRKKIKLMQAYLKAGGGRTDRIRFDGKIWVRTRKRVISAYVREEREEVISKSEANALMKKTKGQIVRKIRAILPAGRGLKWEVDTFSAPMKGLVIAEIEIPSVRYVFRIPRWLGPEITKDRRFSNSALSRLTPKREKKLWRVIARLLDSEP